MRRLHPFLVALCNVVVFAAIAASDPSYPVSAIPQELQKNANVIVREDHLVFEVTSMNSAKLHVHYVATIMNANGNDYSTIVVSYDKNRRVKNIRAIAYDANGESIKKVKQSEIFDRSAIDGATLFTDNRVKIIDLQQAQYPYTIEYEYDIEYDFLFFIPSDRVGVSSETSVQNFSYELIYPKSLQVRYKQHNIDTQPIKKNIGSDRESVKWVVTNQPTWQREPYADQTTRMKFVEAAPIQFQFDEYKGDMSSWRTLGKWQATLNEGRDELPAATVKKAKELTANLSTTEEKVKALYEFMQSRTRYVSIQLGIGGFQPFDAKTVDETGYGDCKALSNYMVSLLKAVGIKGYYTWIQAGKWESTEFDPTFPSNQGNHIIVGVPMEKDTVWLECTSQTVPYGYISDFTDNRYGLMITETGGHIVKTTHYLPEMNKQVTKAEVNLDASGNAKAKVSVNYSGLQYENDGLSFMLNRSADDQKKWLQKNIEIPNFEVTSFKFGNIKGKIPTATVQADLLLNRYASVSNKRLFITPNLMNRWSTIPEKVDNRTTPFEFVRGYVDLDTIVFNIPESLYPEHLPQNTKIESPFGSYESGFKMEAGKLIYIRRMTMKEGKYKPELYGELVNYFKNVSRADNTKIVLLNKT